VPSIEATVGFGLSSTTAIDATVDFAQWLDGPVFEPLKDPQHFRRFFLEGGTVAWPCGADIAPETLYEHAKAARVA
jgi:hypothetical protein